jgi:dihydroflavonol-4-reductase
MDAVIHLAAKISISRFLTDDLRNTNILGTKNILDASRKHKIKRFIHFSSIHALDNSPLDKPMDETQPMASKNPLPYEMTKAAGEKLVYEACKDGLDASVINPTAILGPHDYKPSLMGQVVMKLYNNSLPALIKGGYDWVDVRDVAIGAVSCIEKGRKGERYILSGKWASLPELSALIGKVSGRKTPGIVVPDWMAKLGVPFMKVMADLKKEHPLYTFESLEIIKMGNTMIRHAKAERELGYTPRELEITVKDTVDWFKNNDFLK